MGIISFGPRTLPENTDLLAIAEGRVPGRYIINKAGRNSDVDGVEDIWGGGGLYPGFPLTGADVFTLVSNSAQDSAGGTGCRVARVFYLDDAFNMFDAAGEPLYFDVSMNGLTPVLTTVSGQRVWRVRALTTGSALTSVGNITVRHTTIATDIFSIMPPGGASRLTPFTVPLGYTGYLLKYSATMLDNTANEARIGIRESDQTGTILIRREFGIATDVFPPASEPVGGLKMLELTDFCFRVTSVSNTNADIAVKWDMLLVRNE
jgi:hypothetical protein